MNNRADGCIPVIDLFAGPGGLGEGFSRYPYGKENPLFKIALSIEKEQNAHSTLTLRAFYRHFAPGKVPVAYYDYLKGKISRDELLDHDDECREAARLAQEEARCIELGDDENRALVRKLIDERVAGKKHWVLIGGPPCQAYSLAGRSRMLGVVRQEGESERAYARRREQVKNEFEQDHRHFLYREYLSIIADHWPPVFVMENVKGLLSAKVNGTPVFPMIRKDLGEPHKALGRRGRGHRYHICSLAIGEAAENELFPVEGLDGRGFLLRAENYGVPQNRHRVILLGVRDDLDPSLAVPLATRERTNLRDVLSGLPSLEAGVSKPKGKLLTDVVREVGRSCWVKELKKGQGGGTPAQSREMHRHIVEAINRIMDVKYGTGGVYIGKARMKRVPGDLGDWLHDERLGGVCNHATRRHMDSDLHRYMFCATFAAVHKRSPKLGEFPAVLLPDHSNAKDGGDLSKFADRFRVQPYGRPATTVTCHISKDGHYFIHPDPSQMRSLTVREAARIQTFPDNYFFEGGRTAQYHQVGNAVPPYLAHQIAGVVAGILLS